MAKAAAAMVPGASRLPFVAGGGGELPDVELTLPATAPDPARLDAYREVCGFERSDKLPPTFPFVLAFPLHMALMTDGSFPFPAVGVVHLENAITQKRAIGASEALALRVRAANLARHPKGQTFELISEAQSGGELVWTATSTILHRGRGGGSSPAGKGEPVSFDDIETSAEWTLPADLGRRYGASSGDRNPIHMHDLTARALGFKKAIAHGMWTKARCLAELAPQLPDGFTVEVAFKKPIFLPATVAFGAATAGPQTRFVVRGAKDGTPHLEGTVS
jgi:acyl dehydratase